MSFFDDLAQFFGQMAGDIIEDTFGEAFSKKLEAIQMRRESIRERRKQKIVRRADLSDDVDSRR
jgi:hypothetical protein